MSGSATTRPGIGADWIRDGAVCLAIAALIVVAKLPGILCPVEIGLDESQLLVQAHRYAEDLLPWRSVDGTSSGPINSWSLLLAHVAGMPLNHQGAHTLGALLSAAIVVVTYLTLRLVLPRPVAVPIAAAGVLGLTFTVAWDFIHLTTEQLPALFLALGFYLWIRPSASQAPLPPGRFLAAVLVGLVPWTKLQGLPIAAAVGAWFVVARWIDLSGRRTRVKGAALVVAALLLPAAAILVPVLLGGAWPQFWNSYVVATLGYAGAFRPGDSLIRAGDLLSQGEFRGLLLAAIALGIVRLGQVRKGRAVPAAGESQRQLMALGLAGSGAALVACLRPATFFGHYEIWLISPFLLLMGALVRSILNAAASAPGSARWRTAAMAAVLVPMVLHSVAVAGTWRYSRDLLADFTREANSRPERLFAGAIREKAPGAKSMVVWGWMPSLYLETGLTCVTRHAIGHFLIDPVPSRDFLRQSFLADLAANRPDVIVDAVATGCFTWYWDIKASGMESFPAFADYVNTNYRLVAKPTMDPAGTPLRIFVRKEP